ncbi:acyl carrier protein [Rhizorhabdus sp. FW153]|uniref:acyl carrier protein n=1 Tax=Rhizorhabdus sp. FW153 TaxID=3400216 RepID=UPI003CF947B7
MANDDVESDIAQMLARERRLPIERIQPSSRLREDLGMDGDDAVEFFVKVNQRFGTDFLSLQENWSRHFSPEGLSLWNTAVVVPFAAAGGATGAALNWPKWAAMLLALAFVFAAYWGLSKLPRRKSAKSELAITVAELIEAVKAGAWSKSYN